MALEKVSSPAFAGAGLYGVLVVKGHCSISRGHNRAAGRSLAAPQGRVRRWPVACRPASSFRGSTAGCPAKRGIPRAGRPRQPPLWPSVWAVCRERSRALLTQAGTASGLALGWMPFSRRSPHSLSEVPCAARPRRMHGAYPAASGLDNGPELPACALPLIAAKFRAERPPGDLTPCRTSNHIACWRPTSLS
jgi:hypothetical protein